MLVECSLVVATCGDMSEADADFSAVELLYEERASSRAFDAVTIGKKMSGEARFGRRRQQRGPPGDEQAVDWSLAAGLAAVLYPSVSVDLSTAGVADVEILSEVAGAVQRGLGRSGLRDLGEHLDTRSAALIVACTPAFEGPIDQLLGGSRRSVIRHMAVDADVMVHMCRHFAQVRSVLPRES